MKRRPATEATRESQAEELLCQGRCRVRLDFYASRDKAEKQLAPSNLAQKIPQKQLQKLDDLEPDAAPSKQRGFLKGI